ncbi:SEC-C domain-containing protein [Nocardiopsis sp. EMB25]|uniref:SEC-C domain-containing protein n=1 Tax=Nocardiopsis sp. EMB25 TaxID=2835867 RepID=UPI00228463D1|nr:SEC-C domain-containing protein [Nocardiopsis sp. EMB25]MCY9783126.1 SEC-C domain-containing protein [Nocardiopsis sp. EMB25]
MVDTTPTTPFPESIPPRLWAALRDLDLPRAVLRELQDEPDEAGPILLEAADRMERAGRSDQGRALLEALREHPPVPEDAQYASIEIMRRLRASGEADAVREAEGMLKELLRPGRLEQGPADLLAEDLQEAGDLERALRCANIASRDLLAEPADDLVDADAATMRPLVIRARVRGEMGLPMDDHDEAGLTVAMRLLQENTVPDWDEGLDAWDEGMPGPDDEPVPPHGLLRGIQVLVSRDDFAEARSRGLLTGDAADEGPDAYFRAAEQVLRDSSGERPAVSFHTVLFRAEEMASFAEAEGLDPADADTHRAWAEARIPDGSPRLLPWPPGRNQPCWCGSGRKYKKCCGSAAHR